MHIHTHYSDGGLTPREVAAFAARAGVELVSVTDHDTVCGAAEAEKCCRERGIAFVNGIEASAYIGDVKIHTLGYGMDLQNTALKDFLSRLAAGSVKRAEEIIFKLNKSGVALTFEDAAAERYSAATPLHAMHIAAAGAKKGYASSRSTSNFWLTALSGIREFADPLPRKRRKLSPPRAVFACWRTPQG